MWRTVKLGEVCELIGGGTPSKRNPKLYGGDIPWATVRDMHSEYLISTEFSINEKGLASSSSKIIPRDNVVIASRVGLGKVCLLKQDTAINQDLRGVVPRNANELDTQFLFYWFKSVAEKIISAGRGATVQGVTLPFLNTLELPLPPLAEQQRIVAKLDAAFAEIDVAVAAVQKNLEDANAIINSGLAVIFQNEANNWEVKKLSEVCMVERGSSPRPIKQYFTNDDGVNWIKIGDTEQDGKYVTSTRQKIKAIGAKKSRHVKVGDFILTNSMSYGRPYIMGIEGYIHDGWFVLRLNKDIDTEYFYYLLISPYVQHQFDKLASGAVVKNISGDLVKKTILTIPPLERQQEIRKKIVEIEAQTQQLKETYKLKLENLIALKFAILTQELQPPKSEAA